MNQLSIKKAGLTLGVTGVIIYLSCVISIALLPKDLIVYTANLLFHGMDFSAIIRSNISLSETIIGLIVTFVAWTLLGIIIGKIYNMLR